MPQSLITSFSSVQMSMKGIGWLPAEETQLGQSPNNTRKTNSNSSKK